MSSSSGSNSVSRVTKTVVQCDGCGATDVPMAPWRLARATGRIRKADLCQRCEAPLQEILANAVPSRTRNAPLPVVDIEEVKKARRTPAKKTARKRTAKKV